MYIDIKMSIYLKKNTGLLLTSRGQHSSRDSYNKLQKQYSKNEMVIQNCDKSDKIPRYILFGNMITKLPVYFIKILLLAHLLYLLHMICYPNSSVPDTPGPHTLPYQFHNCSEIHHPNNIWSVEILHSSAGQAIKCTFPCR